MSNPTLEGMARAGWNVQTSRGVADFDSGDEAFRGHMKAEMKAALLWLADNVSDEMLNAFFNEKDRGKNVRGALSAALRAAAEGK